MVNVTSFPHAAVAALVALMATTGCLSTRTSSPAAESFDSLGISVRGIRASNMRLAYRQGLTVEEAADSIIALATDQTTRLNAYQWKIYCIPVIRQVYSQTDPVASAVDALVFSIQCENYFTAGLGKNRFGPYQQIAINATAAIRLRLIEGNRAVLTSTDFDSLISKTTRWANNHPLTNHLFDRSSVVPEMDDIIAQRDFSIGSAVGRIAEDVDDLSTRLSLLSAQLPREGRWQAEYILADLSARERLTLFDSAITTLTASLAGMEAELSSGEIVVDLKGLRLLHADIQAALNLVSSERAILVKEIERVRFATLVESEQAAERTLANALDRVEAIVNRVLLKIGIALVIGFAGLALFVVLARRVRRREVRDGRS
jgi:hypothetical protein